MTPNEMIENFKREYKEVTGREVVVQEKVLMEKMPLDKLHQIVQETFGVNPLQKTNSSKGRKTRETRFLVPRYAMYKVALDMGYKQQEIGDYADAHHTAVGWAIRSKVTHWPEYTEALEKLRNAVTNK